MTVPWVRQCRPVLAVLLLGVIVRAASAQQATALIHFDRPFLFAYGTWEKRAKVENGIVVLNAEGLTPKGGGGVNQNFDFSSHAQDCPGLRVKVGPRNTLKTLRLLLSDTSAHTATWNFTLPTTAAEFTLVTPIAGAPFSLSNEPGKTGSPDLGKIMQWQLIGDWVGDGAVDVQVDAITSVPVNAAIRESRAAAAKDREAARITAENERKEARLKYAKRGPDSPEVQVVYAAAPDILALQIHTGNLTPCKLTDYLPLPGDQRNDNGGKDRPHLIRGGQDIGMLIGAPGAETGLVRFEGYTGEPLLLDEADDPTNYKVTSTDDPAFAQGVAPIKVMRKSKPDDWQQPIQANLTVLHDVYLKLPHALTPGKTYKIDLGYVNSREPEVTFVFDTAKAWTESIHVNQIGFRPDDPLKRAFLSLWMGDGGECAFPSSLRFHLVDAQTDKRVYTGEVGETWPADKLEKMQTTHNFNGTPVTVMDFSDFKTPGRYRVEVEGVGCSYPFDISPNAWEQAFWVQMKGFFNQRSGIALGPPYTDFVRPICWKPGVNGCLPITQSTFSIVDGNPDGKGNLASGDTGKPVPEAWGGYHDAGDWNPRRIDHMLTTTFWQLELLQLFPDYFKTLKLRIPNDAPGPDLLKECLFELDLFRRLQLPDGSVRFGIETDGDPSAGEVSWKQHMRGYVYAPDIESSYIYAAVAARASHVLEDYDKALAATYRSTAIKAMGWAEADRARRMSKGTWDKLPNRTDEVHGLRNLASGCLYELTHDQRWNTLFLEDTILKTQPIPAFRGNLIGRSAAFLYARLPAGLGDPEVKQNARTALIADADGSLSYQQNNAFEIASDDFGKPQFLGFYSTPHGAVSLVRAYQLTNDAKYIKGAIKACLFPGGANPNNLVYTSGLGANPTKAMNMDSIASGQKPPIGLTPYGNIDLAFWHDDSITWPLKYFVGKLTQPDAFRWPTAEAYWDLRFWPMYNEFCIDQTMGYNAYVWGYLAARK